MRKVKAKKSKPLPGPHAVYSEGKGWLGRQGSWEENFQDAEILNTSSQAKARARRAFRYSQTPVVVQIVPMLVFDRLELAQWYEASKKRD